MPPLPLSSLSRRRLAVVVIALALATLAIGGVTPTAADGPSLASGDGYIRAGASRWVLGTASVEKTRVLDKGQLLLTSFVNRRTGREMVPAGRPVVELSPRSLGADVAAPWTLAGSSVRRLAQGELQLDLTLTAGPLAVVRSYLVYPETSVIREWSTCRNAGRAPLTLVEPAFLNLEAQLGAGLETLDFHWMTGARNEPGCWSLRTRQLLPHRPQRFDSYDRFPGHGGHPTGGDGIDAKMTLNDRQVWPATGWRHCPADADEWADFDLRLDIRAGDRLAFVVSRHGNHGYDTTEFDPTIAYDGGESHVASQEFAARQGEHGWRYGQLDRDGWKDLAFDRTTGRWAASGAVTPFVAARLLHPGPRQDVVRQWTAPRAGRVRVRGAVANVGDAGLGMAPKGHRMGSESYAPWYALFDRGSRSGIVVGWDYMGHWASAFTVGADATVTGRLRIAGHRQTLQPGESLTTPMAFTAVYRDDLDDAGNEILDWQYRYLWDYTRDGWFPAIPMLHNWHRGTGWGEPGVPWWGSGRTDIASQFTKVFRAADLIRHVGADLYHRDWGWWDRAGDWNGPDFGATGRYLAKAGIGQIIYAFIYTVDPQSKLARAHPDWLLGETLDLSRPEVVRHLQGQLDDFHRRWGDFAWRNDSTPTAPRGGDDTPLLAQDQNFRALIRGFLDRYPRSSFQSVNGGGNEAGYDYVRLSGMFQFTDGGSIGPRRNYYTALLLPPDKCMDNGDEWRPDQYDARKWRSLLSMALMSTGDTWDKDKLEGVRQLFDLYHYLVAQGVAGRWVKVYRPAVDGADPTTYLQRLSRDRRRGLIVPALPAPGKVVIRPRGLLPEEKYRVTFHDSPAEQERTGRDLMERGIVLDRVAAGELIYLNLPLHPGSRRDRTPPTAAGAVSMCRGDNMGYPGVELTWKPGSDDNWVSHYRILRDGALIDKVAKGTYYFDHSAGADLAARYEVVTVDGAGNLAPAALARGPAVPRSQVIDDADAAARFQGGWRTERGLQPAHRETIASSGQKGSSFEVTVEGSEVLLFSRLGDDCGKAAVSIDGGSAEPVDTYCSDDVWGVCVYRKRLPAGKHILRVTVSGEKNARSKGHRVYVDGIRAEP